jgi:2-dehydro-3-deoxyglucarate aldolase/4-hydroxy-2-oxoheptanedioate aldolase
MRENTVKRTLESGGTAFGVMLFELGTLGSARLADSAGADFVIWDMEHTGWTTETVRQVMAAARLGRAWPLVRVPRAHYHLIATALDAGAMGVMVPMVETAEEARLVVDSVKYPPAGKRGYGAVYPDMTPDGPAGWMETSNRETLVIVQIETVKGLEDADAIIGTEGIDLAWLGHYDLTASMGIPGQFEHPDYLAAVEKLLMASKAHRKPFGIMVTSAEAGREQLARGFRCIALGDIWVYHQALAEMTGALRTAAAKRGLA